MKPRTWLRSHSVRLPAIGIAPQCPVKHHCFMGYSFHLLIQDLHHVGMPIHAARHGYCVKCLGEVCGHQSAQFCTVCGHKSAFSSCNCLLRKRWSVFSCKPINQRLNGHHARVWPVSISNLSRQSLGNAALLRYLFPLRRRDASQIAAQRFDDRFMCHAPNCNPIFGNEYHIRERAEVRVQT